MIDLDGLLDNYSTYDKNSIPEIKIGAVDFIERLDKTGKYELILFTTRSPKLATEWLIKNKIDKYFKDVTNVKYPAYIYLDDRAVQFRGDYKTTFDEIEKFNIFIGNDDNYKLFCKTASAILKSSSQSISIECSLSII